MVAEDITDPAPSAVASNAINAIHDIDAMPVQHVKDVKEKLPFAVFAPIDFSMFAPAVLREAEKIGSTELVISLACGREDILYCLRFVLRGFVNRLCIVCIACASCASLVYHPVPSFHIAKSGKACKLTRPVRSSRNISNDAARAYQNY